MNRFSVFAKPGILSATLLAIAALQGCGGSSSNASTSTVNDNPGGVSNYTPTNTQHYGTVSGLGSVVVNGVRFETMSSTLQDSDDLYGNTTGRKALALGMTVAIDGEADDAQRVGRAHKIRWVGGVRGTISSYTPGQALTVGGQTIEINANTLLADATAQTLMTGDFVNIDGLMQADNRFVATRIHKTSADQFSWDAAWRGQSSEALTDASGTQFNLDAGPNQNFTVVCPVNTCRVEPSGASLSNTHAVRVVAASDAQRTGTRIVADRVQVLDAVHLLRWDGSTQGNVKIKGVAVLNGTQWMIGGTPVVGSNANWVAGQFYEVKGSLSNGVLTVVSWELEGSQSHSSSDSSSSVPQYYRHELYGAVSNLQGTRMVVQGVTVDVSQAYFKYGSAATLSNGLYVEIKGTMQNGILMASKVEIKSGSSSSSSDSSDGSQGYFEVYGTVSHWSATGFTLTSGSTTYDAVINAQTRIESKRGAPDNGRFVEVKGYMSGTQLIVLKLEVEN